MKLSLSRWLAAATLTAATTFSLFAAAKLAKTGASTVGFKVAGPAGMSIEGSTADLAVGDDGQTLGLVVRLTTLTTGIGTRDKHMKEALEVDAYPSAELDVPRASLRVPAGAPTSGDAKGTMKLHGKTKEITFRYVATPLGDGFDVLGSTRIDMRDFGILPPTYLGVGVKPEVDLVVHFQAKDG